MMLFFFKQNTSYEMRISDWSSDVCSSDLDDLIGRLCDPDHPEHDPSQAKAWTYLNVPAVLKPGPLADALGAKLERSKDPDVVAAVGHEPIAALWPEEFPLRPLARAKALDPLGFGAPYLGKLTPATGSSFHNAPLSEYDPGDLPTTPRSSGPYHT